MNRRATPQWMLSNDWGVGTDPYNWVLYRKGKKNWRPVGYYPSDELLLKSFHRKLTRTEPADPDLVRHVEAISRRAQAAAAAFYDLLDAEAGRSKRWSAPGEAA